MKAGTVTAPVADKRINNTDCVERILAIVERLKQEINDRDADYQVRVKQAIEATESRVQEQCRFLRERAVAEAKEATRKDVTQTLLNRFDLEIAKLHANFDGRLRDVIAEAEALAQLKIESAVAASKEAFRHEVLEEAKQQYEPKLNEMEALIAQLKDNGAAASSAWQSERQQLQERIATLERAVETANAVRTENLDGYKELKRKLQEAIDSRAQLQLDLQRTVSELNSRAESAGKSDSALSTQRDVTAIVESEILRVRLQLDGVEKALADPGIDLGSEIRLSRERAELGTYLKGLRYSLGEVTLQATAVENSCRA